MGGNRRENLLKKHCWPYEKSETPSYPVIEVKLVSPQVGRELPRVGSLRLKVDTGYAGHIMVSTDLYNQGFQLAEFPEEKFGIYRTASGLIEVKRARGIVRVVRLGTSMKAVIETPRYTTFNRNLAGRRFLREFRLLLNGPKAESCLTMTVRP